MSTGLESTARSGEVGGSGEASDVSVACAIQGDAVGPIFAVAAEVGAIDEGRARGVQFRHECIIDAAAVAGRNTDRQASTY